MSPQPPYGQGCHTQSMRALTAAIALAFLASACGGAEPSKSDSSPSTYAPTTSKLVWNWASGTTSTLASANEAWEAEQKKSLLQLGQIGDLGDRVTVVVSNPRVAQGIRGTSPSSFLAQWNNEIPIEYDDSQEDDTGYYMVWLEVDVRVENRGRIIGMGTPYVNLFCDEEEEGGIPPYWYHDLQTPRSVVPPGTYVEGTAHLPMLYNERVVFDYFFHSLELNRTCPAPIQIRVRKRCEGGSSNTGNTCREMTSGRWPAEVIVKYEVPDKYRIEMLNAQSAFLEELQQLYNNGEPFTPLRTLGG